MGNDSHDWSDLPRPVAGIRLFQIREELRKKNLHDTEEPPLESPLRRRLEPSPTTCAPATARTTTSSVPGWAVQASGSGATCP